MAMPLTERNISVCWWCRDCISGRGCRYLMRNVNFRPEKIRSPGSQSDYYKEWYALNREKLKVKRSTPMEKIKARAHEAVRKAIISGDMVPKDKCEFCGRKVELVAHHPNYNDFFKVIWCCKGCHRKLHKAVSLSL